MPTSTINLKLKSFAYFDDAWDMCHLIKDETGLDYIVISDEHLGFTIIKSAEVFGTEKSKEDAHKTIGSLEKSTYRQSFRGFVEHFFEMIIGGLLAVRPFTALGWILSALNVETIPEWFNLPAAGKVVSIAGYILMLYGLRFVYSYFARKLFIEDEFVLSKRGIIAQDHIQIRYVDIKTVGIRQSIIERLLGIGTLHLASAGTNGEVDIIFDNLINPAYMRSRVQKLIAQSVDRQKRGL